MSWRSDALKLPAVKSALSSCEAGAKELKGTNDALQASRDDTASKLRAYKLRQRNCTILLTNAKQAGGGPVGGNAPIVATTDDLYDYAAVCRNYWVERQLLEKLITR